MIKVIGIGLDGVESLSFSSQKIIAKATVLVGGKRHLDYFLDHPAQKLIINNLPEVITEIKQYQKQSETIVILATGDPLFFGIGRLLIANFGNEELEFYPHVSCVQIAFNRLHISWQDAKFVSIHGRELDSLITTLKKTEGKIAILTDYHNNTLVIWQLLEQLNLNNCYDFWVCENLASEREKISLINSKSELKKESLNSLNVVILIRKEHKLSSQLDLNNLPLIGLDDDLFASFPDRPKLITKKEIRLIILGKLSLLSSPQVIWDIGAGTGSVSIEMARLSPNSQIYAIEKSAIGASLINQNCQRFKVNNIEIITAEATKIINDLPKPDRVFIGGSSGNLLTILEIIKSKLKTQGKVVIALATLENLADSLTWLKINNWNYQIEQIQINQSLAIANLTRFNPLNPVQIITIFPNA